MENSTTPITIAPAGKIETINDKDSKVEGAGGKVCSSDLLGTDVISVIGFGVEVTVAT